MKNLVGKWVFVASLMMPLNAFAAESFTDAQKTEIGTIVRDYLLKHPEIFQDMSDALQVAQQQKQGEAAKQSIAENAKVIFHSPKDLVLGNPNGKITLVEFFDYNCGFCKRALPDVQALIESDKDVKVVMKEFPILGESSMLASKFAIASKQQGKYQQLHEALISAPGHLDDAKILEIANGLGLDTEMLKKEGNSENTKSIIFQNNELARKLGINGTPAFILGDTLIAGAVGLDALKSQVAQLRKDGCAVC